MNMKLLSPRLDCHYHQRIWWTWYNGSGKDWHWHLMPFVMVVSIHPSIHLFSWFMCLSIYIIYYLFIYVSIDLNNYISIYLYLSLSLLFYLFLSMFLSLSTSIYFYLYLYVYLFFYLFIYLSIWFYPIYSGFQRNHGSKNSSETFFFEHWTKVVLFALKGLKMIPLFQLLKHMFKASSPRTGHSIAKVTYCPFCFGCTKSCTTLHKYPISCSTAFTFFK